jgi:hypothetical protein
LDISKVWLSRHVTISIAAVAAAATQQQQSAGSNELSKLPTLKTGAASIGKG